MVIRNEHAVFAAVPRSPTPGTFEDNERYYAFQVVGEEEVTAGIRVAVVVRFCQLAPHDGRAGRPTALSEAEFRPRVAPSAEATSVKPTSECGDTAHQPLVRRTGEAPPTPSTQ